MMLLYEWLLGRQAPLLLLLFFPPRQYVYTGSQFPNFYQEISDVVKYVTKKISDGL
jgi:hypothetical protein